ncbi:MAG: peptide-methionine (R)-S-oxide reductase MsrB [Candidatus Campbellbacteria bacterium]|nr:peptide-methionine (R)-S-oxide reductase MsrB [Candidatus Campbellbacteria bacterium]
MSEQRTQGWRGALTPEQRHVLWEKGTEAPFSGAYVHTNEKGVYRCVSCGAELFSSETKFDSKTGWPSFDQALPGATKLQKDEDDPMHRTEVVCAKCGGHLGHVFDDPSASPVGDSTESGSGQAILRNDGTPATKRYCINSVCLDLEPK